MLIEVLEHVPTVHGRNYQILRDEGLCGRWKCVGAELVEGV